MIVPADLKALAELEYDQSQLLELLFSGADTTADKTATMDGFRQLALPGSAREALTARGLLAYRANGTALAERALAASYPVLAQLIGGESFPPLARHFWRHAPPLRGDVAQWGAGLAEFVDSSPQLASEPFLGDVARAEWALHCAASAADSSVDMGSFALLGGSETERTTLTLSDGVVLLASAWPVVSIINAHLHAEPTLAQAADLLGAGVSEHALVWRQGFKPRLRQSSAAEHAFVTALQAGFSIEAALTTTGAGGSVPGNSGGLDFNNWLTQAVQSGLVIGAHFLNSANKTEEETS